MFKKMKAKIFPAVILFFLISLLSHSPEVNSFKSLYITQYTEAGPQNIPVKKPKYDYMSKFLSRNTKPLGLKEDLVTKKLLKQANIKWAIRSEERHILY